MLWILLLIYLLSVPVVIGICFERDWGAMESFFIGILWPLVLCYPLMVLGTWLGQRRRR